MVTFAVNMKTQLLLLVLCVILFMSCDNNGVTRTEDGKEIFVYKPLSWQMEVPDGWQVLSKDRRVQLGNSASAFYGDEEEEQETVEKEIIFGAKKADKDINAVYGFIAKYTPGKAEPPDMNELLRRQRESYNMIPYSAETSVAQETINGHRFDIAVMQVYYDERPYFKYTTYSTMIDTVNFGITIISNNKVDESMLEDNFKKSVTTLGTVY